MEVAAGVPDIVPVRDSKVPYGPVLAFGAGAWGVFIGGVKAGRRRV